MPRVGRASPRPQALQTPRPSHTDTERRMDCPVDLRAAFYDCNTASLLLVCSMHFTLEANTLPLISHNTKLHLSLSRLLLGALLLRHAHRGRGASRG
jgi:hypothetical protein